MTAQSFEQEWSAKVRKVRASAFWQQVSSPPAGRIERAPQRPRRNEVEVDAGWALAGNGELAGDGPATMGMEDLRRFLASRFGVCLQSQGSGPRLLFELTSGKPVTRWDTAFELDVAPERISIRAPSEAALLRASLYLSNYWSLRRNLYLAQGRRRVRPAVSLHLGADLWGGFSTTQAWVHGREQDDNFLELARLGINGMPVMTLLEDYIETAPEPFACLVHPQARRHRQRLGQLVRQAARCNVHLFLMGYNPKLPVDHSLFSAYPQAQGAVQFNGAFRTLCTSDPQTRQFLVDAWASLFAQIPELGGILGITGGEGFYHCFMRSAGKAADCPRCSRRSGSEVVAELVNDLAAGIQARAPEAQLLTWPYSAGHWSHDRDQADFIERLDPQRVVFQTEIDKDSVDWRPAGYAKNIWDYSMSRVTISPRCRAQRRHCRERRLPFSVKIECNNSIECLNVPYLPALENQKRIWENARQLRPQAIHSRWLFDGACKSPSEELGFWAIWGKDTEFADLDQVLAALATRDFGPRAAPHVRRAWGLFSEALRHHPQLDYYIGSYFVGPAQPLILDPEKATIQDGLDPAFFGRFYWQWEDSATDDDTAFALRKPLFFARPGFRAIARRGPDRGRDVALEELREMARLWERGMRELETADALAPAVCRARFQQEFVLAQHLAYTWRSAAQVEEFLRRRDTVREFSRQSWVRAGHRNENRRDLARLEELARAELELARKDLALVRDVDFLDLALRLDMGVASTVEMLEAKIRQVEKLLATELPVWRTTLQQW